MKKIVAAVLLSAVAGSAFAADQGIYVGATLGSGKPGLNSTAGMNKTSEFVYGGLVGYKFSRNLAAEASFTGIGKVTDLVGNTAKGDAFTLSAVGTLPVTSSFDLYGKLGFSSSKTTSASAAIGAGTTRTGLSYGIGGQYNVSNSVGVRFGWDSYPIATLNALGGKTNVNASVISAGVVVNF